MKLKVYGWQSFRSRIGRHGQTREIIAAKSKAQAARASGNGKPRRMFNLCETGNDDELKTALAEPLVVFWRPLDQLDKDRKYTRDGTDWSAVESIIGNSIRGGKVGEAQQAKLFRAIEENPERYSAMHKRIKQETTDEMRAM